jgi:DNA primase
MTQPAEIAFDRLVRALEGVGSLVRLKQHKATAQCPAHDDRTPSLALTRIEGGVLVHCFAGCDTSSVLDALKLDAADLYDNPRGMQYRYPGGRLVYRAPQKRFWQKGNVSDTSLFGAEQLPDGGPVYLVEGEKDVLAVRAAGGAAVSAAGGSVNVDKADVTVLAGRDVIAISMWLNPMNANVV